MTATGQQVLVHEKAASLSVAVDTFTVLTYDTAGRLLGAFWRGRHYRRGLNHRIREKWSERVDGERVRHQRDLSEAEKRDLLAQFDRLIEDLHEALAAGRVTVLTGEAERAWALLARIRRYDRLALERDAERFRSVYQPIGILPPDQYLALVLQATEGCHWNRCTFCDFYRDRPFRAQSPAEFRAHLAAVRAYFGETLALRKSIFLGDANALVLPSHRLHAVFDAIQEAFLFLPEGLTGKDRAAWKRAHPIHFEGIYSFLDTFSAGRKTEAEFRALRDRHLRRVYLGIETGHDPLLRFLHKPSAAAEVVEVVRTLKAAGLQVGLILMVGIGGERYAAGHVEDTIRLVNALPLGAGDLIYFSEFLERPGSEYARQATAADLRPLSPPQQRAQRAALQAGFRFREPEHPPKMAAYDLREFIY